MGAPMLKRLFALVMLLAFLPACALGEGYVINLIQKPDAQWAFREGVPILEMFFPPARARMHALCAWAMR